MDYDIIGTFSFVTPEDLKKAKNYAKAGLFFYKKQNEKQEEANLSDIERFGPDLLNIINNNLVKLREEREMKPSPFLLKLLFLWVLFVIYM